MAPLWAREHPVTDAAKDAEVSERMAIDMYGWYWDVCTQSAICTHCTN